MDSGKTIDWDEEFYVRTESERKQSLQRLLDALPDIGDLDEEKLDNDITNEANERQDLAKNSNKEKNDDFRHANLLEIAIYFEKEGKHHVAAELAKKISNIDPKCTIASLLFFNNQHSILSQSKEKVSPEKFDELLEIIKSISDKERKLFKKFCFEEAYVNVCLMKYMNSDGGIEKLNCLTEANKHIEHAAPTPRMLNYTFLVNSHIARICDKADQKISNHYKALKFSYMSLQKDNKNINTWDIILTNIEKILNFSSSKRESLDIIETISKKIDSYKTTFNKNPYLIHNIAYLHVKKAEATIDEAEQDYLLSKAEKMLDKRDRDSPQFNKLLSNTLRANISILKAKNELTFYKKIALLNEAIRLCEEHIYSSNVSSDTFAYLAHAYRDLSNIEKDAYRKRFLLEEALKIAKQGVRFVGCHMQIYSELSQCYEKLATMVEETEEASNYKAKSILYKKQMEEHRI